jgi:hypothetical protein
MFGSFFRVTATVALAALFFSGCGDDTRLIRDGADGGPSDGPPGEIISGCSPTPDSDGDGIADQAEGTSDIDGDGTPNHLDDDSDGDGIPDSVEHQGAEPCRRVDSDGDGTADWWDTDSDNDGLSDADENGVYFTDPTVRDTDGDGVTDLGEALGTRTDPNDASSTIDPGDFFVVLQYMGPREERTLRFGTDISVADVYFLIDTTGSMGTPIANVQSSLSSIAVEIQSAIPNVQMGVGQYRDFPLGSSGPLGIGYGSPGDDAYKHEQDITDDLSQVQAALDRLSAGGGADGPESLTEALYQTATGAGGSWSDGSGSYSIPSKTCPMILDEVGTRRGYPCFRPGALPIIIGVTDINSHEGTDSSADYAGITPETATLGQGVSSLQTLGARFIGVAVTSTTSRADLEHYATETGTVGASGPLVYDAPSGAISGVIVDGIEELVGGVVQDVSTRTENVDGNPDDFDATQFIKAIVAVEGYGPGGVAGTGYDSKSTDQFFGVVPGTQVDFSIDFYNDVRPPADTSQIFEARIIVVGNGVADLDSRNVYIVVPPEGAVVLI